MKYPVISIEELERLASERLAGTSVDVQNSISWVGADPEVDLGELASVGTELAEDLEQFKASDDANLQDFFEGQAAGKLHAALRHLPLPVLDDPGFWRYVSAAHLWDLVVWRQSKTFDKDWTEYRKYIDGRNHAECVALRMFLRGQIARRSDNYDLSSAVKKATDLWRSHIVRIRTSYSPLLAQGLVDQVVEHELTTDDVRPYAKRITRVASNVVLHTYDKDEVDHLLHELRDGESSPAAT
jgi:hypothetical protein